MIVKIEQMDLTARVVADLGDRFFGVGEEFIATVEDGDRLHAIQCRLDAECGRRAAGTEHGHLLANDIDTRFAKGAHIAGAVGDMPGQDAVVIDHGIHRPDQLRRRRQLIEILANLGFVRHRDVKAAQLQSPEALDNVFQLLITDFKSQVDVVQPEMGESLVVHGGRHAVANRGGYQTNQLSVSSNTFCHDKNPQ